MSTETPLSSRAAASLPEAETATAKTQPRAGFWPHGWWKLMDIRIGVLPLPVIVGLAAILAGFIALGKLPMGPGSRTPNEICTAIAILAVGGFACGELGKRLPILRHFGAGAIFAAFIPSCLAFHHLVPTVVEKSMVDFARSTNFLYLFIAAVIVGSILGMDRAVLIKGFLKIFIPLSVGSLAAILVGTGVGTLLGLGARHTLLYVVIPIMAGGVGEGAIPLSVGYADILHTRSGDEFAMVLPPVMFGSLIATLLSGALNFLGKRYPHLTGEGRLQPGEHDDMNPNVDELPSHIDVGNIAAAGSMAILLYLAGLFCSTLSERLPAPVVMLFLAVVVKLTFAAPPKIQQGAHVVYKFFATAVTYPLLFAIGVAMTPWDKLVAALHPANLITIVATVVTLMTTGFLVARWVRLFPIDTAIVNACHSGQGGTGDVAILTAANRMQLMPFAQIATRIGGAITVTVILFSLARFG